MAPRANWKGFLKVAELTCPVALYTAASTAERIAFHIVNRATGNRVQRQFVDSDTGQPVKRDDQVKGYAVGQDDYVVLEPQEIAAAIPDSDKTLAVEAFVACADIDEVYLDKPYYLAPADRHGDEAFTLIRDGMRVKKVAALARTVLFRRLRTLLIRPYRDGLIADTLRFDYEVRPAAAAFAPVAELTVKGEMLELARHIIKTKAGRFDPRQFDDRYEAALAELVKAKLAGKTIAAPRAPKRAAVVDLMEALRQSAGRSGKRATKRPAKAAPARRKTG